MQFDIDRVLDAVNPWELIVTVDGQSYATRRPSVAELAVFQSAVAHPDRLPPLAVGLFVGEPPDVGGWSIERLMAFLGGYLAYFTEVAAAGKPLAAVMTAAAAAVTSAATGGAAGSGGSPPPP